MEGVGAYDVFWDETALGSVVSLRKNDFIPTINASLQAVQWDYNLSREGMKYSGLLSP